MRLTAKVLLPGTGYVAFSNFMDLVGRFYDGPVKEEISVKQILGQNVSATPL